MGDRYATHCLALGTSKLALVVFVACLVWTSATWTIILFADDDSSPVVVSYVTGSFPATSIQLATSPATRASIKNTSPPIGTPRASTPAPSSSTHQSAAPAVPLATIRQQPRMVSYQRESQNSGDVVQSMPLTEEVILTYKRKIKPKDMIEDAMMDWRRRFNARDKTKEEAFEGKPWRDVPGQKYCQPLHEWQTKSFPACNTIHETVELLPGLVNQTVKYLALGGYRYVWKIHVPHKNNPQKLQALALKTLKYEREYYERQFERHILDALTSDRLKASPNVLDIYAYCGTSAVYELADGGDLEDYIKAKKDKLSSKQKVQLSYNVAQAVADAHNWEHEGQPWFAHADMATRQFVRSKSDDASSSSTTHFKLTDFNRARLLFQNNQTQEQCGFLFRNAVELTRSPEEFARNTPQTEKIDVYSMGNIFYEILTGHGIAPRNADEKKFQEQILSGWRPPMDEKWEKDQDPLVQAILASIRMCWQHEPEKRSTARQVERHLANALKETS